HSAFLQFLIQIGADVDLGYADPFGSPLLAAASKGHESTVRLLIECSAHTSSDEEIELALFAAAYDGHDSVVQYLIGLGVDVKGSVAVPATPLQVASARGHQSVARRLIDHGADVNGSQGSGAGTSLLAASMASGKYNKHYTTLAVLTRTSFVING
ncbi:ankyrin repeat-containing domain protein, partial [Mycena polygramma]